MCFFVCFIFLLSFFNHALHTFFKSPTACPKNAPSFCVFCSKPLPHLGQYVSFNFDL